MDKKHKEQELLKAEYFDVLMPYIEDVNVTDIDWNGTDLWITDIKKGRYLSDIKLESSFIVNLYTKLSNIQNQNFNRHEPILETSFCNMRISIWHESLTRMCSLSIRDNPPFIRLASREYILETNYCSSKMLNFLENCVKAHMNIVIGGLPEVGKTELLKYLTQFIPANEKAGVYEDNPEIHYRVINPGKDCVEVCLNSVVDYERIISAGVRHNVKWTILSEAREGTAVEALLNNLSSGVHCITTTHTDDMLTVPDRLFNMIGDTKASSRLINNVYRYLDVGILVTKDETTQKREVSQICLYAREEGKNLHPLIYDYGTEYDEAIPPSIRKQFNRYGIMNPFEEVQQRCI